MENTERKMHEQMKNIQENLIQIKIELEKCKGPFFIELIGTPKSGKTTLLNHFKSLFEKANIPFQTRKETAEYNPIENKEIEEYEIWMVMELLRNLSEDIGNSKPRIVMYDRGILDRIPWLDVETQNGLLSVKDLVILKELFNTNFMSKYRPITYNLITSPELSVKRKGKPGRTVNIPNMQMLNEYLCKENETLANFSSKYTVIKTDRYQGRLKEFIVDIAQGITCDILEIMRNQEYGVQGKQSKENEAEK